MQKAIGIRSSRMGLSRGDMRRIPKPSIKSYRPAGLVSATSIAGLPAAAAALCLAVRPSNAVRAPNYLLADGTRHCPGGQDRLKTPIQVASANFFGTRLVNQTWASTFAYS